MTPKRATHFNNKQNRPQFTQEKMKSITDLIQ